MLTILFTTEGSTNQKQANASKLICDHVESPYTSVTEFAGSGWQGQGQATTTPGPGVW